jgi:hypothetical protein
VVIRHRPRRVLINRDHPAHKGPDGARRVSTSVALEVAYLLGSDDGSAGVYDRMLAILRGM